MQRRSVPVVRLTWDQFDIAAMVLAGRIRSSIDPHERIVGVYGEPRGGLTLAVALSHRLRLPLLPEPEEHMLWCDDIVDRGDTVERVIMQSKPLACVAWIWDVAVMRRIERRVDAPICITHDRKTERGWYVFPWEDAHQAARDYDAYMSRRR